MKLKTLDSLDVKNKFILLRVDLNSPVKNNKVQLSPRLKAHAETISELASKGARICIVSWQGRKGQPDFLSLSQHSELLSKILHKKVKFVSELYGEKAIKSIKQLKPGEILLLENTRFFNDEPGNEEILKIADLFDIFVQDALSVCHRDVPSVTGFARKLPYYIGRVLESELSAADKLKKIKATYVLGGAKPSDIIGICNYILKNNKGKILSCGLFGQSLLVASGKNLGEQNKYLEKVGALDDINSLKKINSRIEKPLDFAIKVNGKRKELSLENFPSKYEIFDIGKKTREKYVKIIQASEAVFLKGTPGYYLSKQFSLGTKEIYKAVSKSKFSVLAGGDTTTAIKIIGMHEKDFSQIILSGGALLEYLSGKKLPGLEVLM